MGASRSVTDSPWFWLYLFGTAALIALALINPKYGQRQAHIEREYQGRQRVAQVKSGQEPTVELSSADDTVISLWPLFFGLAGMTVVAWVIFWRKRLARRAASEGRQPEKSIISSMKTP